MAHSGEKINYYGSGLKMIANVFATLPAIDLLDDSFRDGIFSTAQVCYQAYSICPSFDGVNLPLLYVLPDKKEELSKTTLFISRNINKTVTIHFEIAVRNALLQLNEKIQTQCCFFHLGQNVWRLVHSAGKASDYNNNLWSAKNISEWCFPRISRR